MHVLCCCVQQYFFIHYNLLDIHTPMGNELCGSSKREWVYMYFQITPIFTHKYSSPGRRACCDSCHVPAYVIHLAANVACLHSLDPPPSHAVYWFLKCFLVWHNSCILQHGSLGVLGDYLHSQKGRLLSLDLFLNYNANSPPCRLK